jgi:hypothetical protein
MAAFCDTQNLTHKQVFQKAVFSGRIMFAYSNYFYNECEMKILKAIKTLARIFHVRYQI